MVYPEPCKESTRRTLRGRLAVGQHPVPPVNIPIPTKPGPKMGGEFTNPPKWDPKTALTQSHFWLGSLSNLHLPKSVLRPRLTRQSTAKPLEQRGQRHALANEKRAVLLHHLFAFCSFLFKTGSGISFFAFSLMCRHQERDNLQRY